MKPLKQSLSITLDEDVLRKTRELAEYQDRSLSSYINLVLKRHLAQMDKRSTQEAPHSDQ